MLSHVLQALHHPPLGDQDDRNHHQPQRSPLEVRNPPCNPPHLLGLAVAAVVPRGVVRDRGEETVSADLEVVNARERVQRCLDVRGTVVGSPSAPGGESRSSALSSQCTQIGLAGSQRLTMIAFAL